MVDSGDGTPNPSRKQEGVDMKFKSLPVSSLEDATVDLEQLQGFLTSGDVGVDSTGKLARVTKINGVAVPLTAAAWTAPALINSWANSGGGFETAGYLKDPMGFVHLKGSIVGGTTATLAFVLPAGFRPGATTLSPSVGTGPSAVQVQIGTGGGVAPVLTSAGSAVGLSGITFLAEN
jgi:hypothetical protein